MNTGIKNGKYSQIADGEEPLELTTTEQLDKRSNFQTVSFDAKATGNYSMGFVKDYQSLNFYPLKIYLERTVGSGALTTPATVVFEYDDSGSWVQFASKTTSGLTEVGNLVGLSLGDSSATKVVPAGAEMRARVSTAGIGVGVSISLKVVLVGFYA